MTIPILLLECMFIIDYGQGDVSPKDYSS